MNEAIRPDAPIRRDAYLARRLSVRDVRCKGEGPSGFRHESGGL